MIDFFFPQNVIVSAKDQYHGQTVDEVEEMLRLDTSLKLVRDGLNVSVLGIITFLCYFDTGLLGSEVRGLSIGRAGAVSGH